MLARATDIATRSVAGSAVEIVVAADDARVADHARELGCRVVMTDPGLACGSERVLAAVDAGGSVATRVLNLQVDAPFIEVATVRRLIEALNALSVGCVTPVVALDWLALDVFRARKTSTPFSGTTCVCDAVGRAMWFSKAIIPAIRDEAARRSSDRVSPVLQHLGLYGYTISALRRFAEASPSMLERVEGLEQLRFLELGIPIQTVPVPAAAMQMSGIDSAEDARHAESLITRVGDPFGVGP